MPQQIFVLCTKYAKLSKIKKKSKPVIKLWCCIHKRSHLNLSLKSKTFVITLDKKLALTFVSVFEQFTKGFSIVLVLSLVLTLRLGDGRLKMVAMPCFPPREKS